LQLISGIVASVVVAVSGIFVSYVLIRSRERERWERVEDA
jgi:hypothetical protein